MTKTPKQKKATTKSTQTNKKKTTHNKKTLTSEKKNIAKKTEANKEQILSIEPTIQEDSISQAEITDKNLSTSQSEENNSQNIQEEKGFFALYFSTWKKSFSFKGRANRSEVFLFPIFNLFVFFALILISDVLNLVFKNNTFHYILMIFTLLTIPASISLLIRRFHDFNKSAIYALTPYIAVIAGFPLILEIMKIPSDMVKYICTIILFMIWITSFIWTLMYAFRSGTKGENKYGIQPLAKKRVIWLNILVFIFTIVLYFVSFAVFMYINLNNSINYIYLQQPQSESFENFPDTLSEEELEAEALKIEEFINSGTTETINEPIIEKKEKPALFDEIKEVK